ncbi:hypothetical protein BP5796_02297 [Coleophoma crateriformis]|uniref:NB-ARC domain-containing protein n=1 Tax=Coleophoma crateriformis TaxID=565419 RepID=A0A3D8SXS8_9HELO|nr:hypothetical protein BP5796_02297 [Coleophoma crateriformis]
MATATDFLRVIADPDGANIDIVAVHGLNPTNSEYHAEQTWTSHVSKKLWLRDFLPQQQTLAKARVLLFGYNANVAFNTSTAGVSEQASNLLNRLDLKREGINDRPILFVCHSLGGIVVKHALVTAKLDDTYEAIRLATYGIVFFATPHQGGKHANLGDIAAKIAKRCLRNEDNSFMEALKKDSLFGEELVNNFRHQIEDFYVLSFVETRPYRKLGLIVDRQSATLGLSGKREKQVHLAADHDSICKFESPEGDDFELVIGNIRKMVQNALNAELERKRMDDLSVPVASLTLKEPASRNYKLGISLSGAPQIDDDIFVGREQELDQLQEWLAPTPSRQNRVVVSGLGGMGKTQLSIHFAKQHHDQYSSIIWLNAKDENTIRAGLVALASRILGGTERDVLVKHLDEDQAVRFSRQWLSESDNKEWLVIFDNYDDPRIPGIKSSTGYDIRPFFPDRDQGSILITTRSSRLSFGDADAVKLAKRLDGLPLALTTAGSYINQTADSFRSYLQMYEVSWKDLAENSDELLDYEDRTLYSTWNLSLKRIEAQEPEAVQMLRLMAYLDNHDLWYELFQKGAESMPTWLSNVVKSRPRFNKVMGKLQEYSLLEVEVDAQSGQYSLHPCVHDWTLECLNCELNNELFRLAVHCIAENTMWDTEADFWIGNRRLGQHVSRIESQRIKESVDWNCVKVEDMYKIAYLSETVGRTVQAETMYERALAGYEKAWGPEHTSTLDTVNNLGLLYKNQGRMAEAETMYERALAGKEKAWGPEHTSTLDTAETMYERALAGYEKAWGPEHTSTLDTVHNLGNLYADQGRMAEAETMYERALAGYEKAWGPEHSKVIMVKKNLELFT